MSDKSFGDHINRNVVKNSLLSSAVIGLSLEDLTHKAVLLPATPTQGQVRLIDKPQGSQTRSLAHADHDKPSLPSGDAFSNIPLSNTSLNTHPKRLATENYETNRNTATDTRSKASAKSEDDFDMNEYIARLQGTRYVSAPLHHMKEDQSSNLEAEESLEEINLNEADTPVQQSLTADIAQNFSQLPTVLPHVASAVFSSFSNMLNMRSREQTPDEAKITEYQSGRPGVPLVGVGEAPKDFGLPPKEPPVTGASNFRITSKKKYAQIPGLSHGGVAQNIYHNPNIPFASGTQHVPPFMTPKAFDNSQTVETHNTPDCQNLPLYGNATVKQNTPVLTSIGPNNDAFKTVDAVVGLANVDNAQYTIDTNVFNPVDSNIASGINISATDNTSAYKVSECPIDVNISQLNAAKDVKTAFAPIDHKDITTPRLPIIPPPPMFSNTRSSQAVGKSVLPPSVARRISANQPLIKPQAVPTPVFDNIFVPSIPENVSDTVQPIGLPQPMTVPMASQASSVPLFKSSEIPASSSVGALSAPFVNPTAESVPPSAVGPFFSPSPSEMTLSTVPSFFTPSNNDSPAISRAFGVIGSIPPSVTNLPSSVSFGTHGSIETNAYSSSVAVSDVPVSSTAPPSNIAPFVQMFTPSAQIPPAFFNPLQTPQDMPHPITQIPPAVTPEPVKPLVEPPKAIGLNFRMTKKRPQYYSGPIEGVGDISNNVKPIIAPMMPPVPSVDDKAYPGSFFNPELPQTVDKHTAPIEAESVPFDITKTVEPGPYGSYEANPQCTPFNVNPQPYAADFNTAFDLSRTTLDAYEPPKQDQKGFGIIGSLKSKLSSIDINKIQSTVTTFFDPAYNAAKGEPVLETTPYTQQHYGQYSQEQNNFEITVSTAEPYSQTGYQQGYSYDQINPYYQAQNAYNYQNEGQNASVVFDKPTNPTQVYNTTLYTNTQEQTSASTNYTLENIPHNVDDISRNLEEEKMISFYNPATIQEQPQSKVESVNYPQQGFEKRNDCAETIAHYVSPNVGTHGAIGDVVKTSANPPIGIDQGYKLFTEPVKQAASFFDSHLASEDPNKTFGNVAINTIKDAQVDSVQSRVHLNAPLPPAISFFDSPITGTQESKIKPADLTDEMEKLALAEEIAIASSPFPAINFKVSANSESKVIETSIFKAVGQKDIPAIALDKNVQNFHINKTVELGADQKGISLIESLSKDTTPIVAVSSVPFFGLSALITDEIKDAISHVEIDQDICLYEATKEITPLLEKQTSFSLFKNNLPENKLHEIPPKTAIGLSIADVKNVLLIEPPQENLGSILQRKASLLKDLPESELKPQNLSEDRDSSWNLDTAVVTSKDNVNMSFDRKASGFFDHLMTEKVEGVVQKKDTDATEQMSDFNICETCREVNSPENKDTENVTNQLIENINSSIQLSNPVESILTESDSTADDRTFENKQFDDINRITEDTIETLQGQSAAELLDSGNASSNNSYGWNTEQLAYASIAAIDEDLVANIGVDLKYNTPIDPEYTFKIDPNAIGFFGDNSLFFDNVPKNASDEIKAELKTHEDVLPRQISIPSAPPAEEEDLKSDLTGVLDVLSIEQDAKKDFPLEEEFVIEPSETDDDKLEFRERKRSSEDSVHDTFAGRIEKFKSNAGVDIFANEDNIYQDNTELVNPPKSMASYFDTGNYAVETHYRKSLTSPTNINTFQEQMPTNVKPLQEQMTHKNIYNVPNVPFEEGAGSYASEEAFRLPPGFEDELRKRFIQQQYAFNDNIFAKDNNEVFIPETSTQTQTTATATVNIANTYEYNGIADSKADNEPSIPVESKRTPTMETYAKDIAFELNKIEDSKIKPEKSDSAVPALAKAFLSTNLLIKDHTQALTTDTIKSAEIEAVQNLPDPVNFFSAPTEQPKEATDPPESFSRLASYFSMPPAQPDHSKSFFELSQSQNHYKHATPDLKTDNKPNQTQIDSKTKENIQNLMQDLTSTQNINLSDNIVRTVNYFAVQHENIATGVSKLETTNLKTNSDVILEKNNLDSLKFNSNMRDKDDVISSINNYNNEAEDSNINIENDNFNTINKCKYCCNTKLIDVKDYSVRTAADSDTRREGEANMSEKGSSNQRKTVSVDFGNLTMDEEAQDGATLVHENRSSAEYTPVRHHWFYRVDVEEKSVWRGFSMTDSNALEQKYLSPDLTEDTVVSTDGGRFDVNVIGRLRIAIYWKEKPTNVRRCSWFYKGTTDARYVPYTEAVADKLEEEYRHGVTTGEWHRRLVLPNSELVVMHGPAVMVHFLHGGCSDSFSSPPPSTSRPRVVRRGYEESEIEDPEPSSIDHLLLLCHGVGSACDMRFRSVEEVVEDFRATSFQLLQSHYRNSYDNGIVSRVEVLPISWHAQLHVGEGGVDKRLSKVTLDSIPRLRAFTNHTVLDALFYTSPVYHQTIIDTVCFELNRIYTLFKQRNPSFKGGISLGGHSLGSVILYDLLCHQTPEIPLHPKSTSHKTHLPGTTQPLEKYPQLKFPPSALYALGSPIAIFECIRGVEALGMDFALPTCKNFFNIFHPYDPIAYRIEPLINPLLQDAKPFLIPHHKGRKRMHLELKDTMVRVGADLKQKLIESLRTTWNKWKSSPPQDGQLEKVVEEEIEKEQLREEDKEEQLNAELTTPEMLGKLNDGRRIDYVLQEAPLEMINEYIFAMSSHVGYWESEDTMLLMLREIYSSLGVQPDCTVPQQSMTVTRTTRMDEATVVNEKDYPSTSRGSNF